MTKDLTTSKFENANEYRKTATIHAVKIDEPFSIQAKEGMLEGKAGDYLAIADDDSTEKPHRWIISQADFEKTYESVD